MKPHVFARQLARRTAVIALIAAAALAAPGIVAAPSVDMARAQAQSTAPIGGRFLQLGSFRSAENARRMLARFSSEAVLNGAVAGFVEQSIVGGVLYHRVRIGPIFDDNLALRALSEARGLGIADAVLQPPVGGALRSASAADVYAPDLSTASTPQRLTTGAGGFLPTASTVSYVQLGAFNDLGAARTLLDRVRGADLGVDGVIHTQPQRGGALHRVIVGPFASARDAAQIETRLRERGVGPVASAIGGGELAAIETANTPIDRSKGPLLQVASYRLPSNAHAAISRLRSMGLADGPYGPGFIEAVEVGGDPVWRVQIGPIHTNADANQALSTVHMLGYHDARLVKP